jgi:hypothetical protein
MPTGAGVKRVPKAVAFNPDDLDAFQSNRDWRFDEKTLRLLPLGRRDYAFPHAPWPR